MIRFVVLVPLAWAAGVGAHLSGLYLIWGQTVRGELGALMIWCLLGLLIGLPVVYLPIMVGLRRWLRGYRPILAFPAGAALAGVFPTALLVFVWGGGLRGLVSPEAGLLYLMFGAVGVVLGLGFAWPGRVASRP